MTALAVPHLEQTVPQPLSEVVLGVCHKVQKKIKMRWTKIYCLFLHKSLIAFIPSSLMKCFSEKSRDSEAT